MCTVSTEDDGCGQHGKLVRERTFIETLNCITEGADTDLRNTENTPCYTDKCECEMSEWSDYECSETVCSSEGVLVSTRGYFTTPDCQVMSSAVRREDGVCKTEPCVCKAGSWSPWVCSADKNYCGSTGTNMRERKYDTSECVLPGSISTDEAGVETQKGTPCSGKPCCGTSAWSEWQCSVTLAVDKCNASGKYVRDRTFVKTEECSTAHAQTDLHNTDNVICHTEKCECELTEWSEYACSESACSSEGVRFSTRGYITTPPCEPKDAELRREDGKCKTQACVCTPSAWSPWVCDSNADVCGSEGSTWRHRKYKDDDCVLPEDTEIDSAGVETQEGVKCQSKSCCELSAWSEWECTVTEDEGCGLTGKLVRDRVFLETDECTTSGDPADLHDTDNAACHTSLCECELSEWVAQPCSCAECSCVGEIHSTRYYKTHAGCQAMDAELTRLDGPCESEPCYVHPSEWTVWACDAPVVCGAPGHLYRERSYDMEQGVLREGVIPDENDIEKDMGGKCHYTPCCETTEWSGWMCTVNNDDHECGVAGKLEQHRTYNQVDNCTNVGDETNLVKNDNEACYTDKCECELSEWSDFRCSETACSSSGMMVSQRYYETGPDCEAKNAELRREAEACETELCACEVSNWTPWMCNADMDQCNAQGVTQRSRTYPMSDDCEVPETVVVDETGLETQMDAVCQSTPCCGVSAWSEWTCTVDNDDGCGLEGHYVRDRKYIRTDGCSIQGDDTDLTNTDNVMCRTDKCECLLSEWSDFACSATACGSTGVLHASRWYITNDDCQTMNADLYTEGDACDTPACECEPNAWTEWSCDVDMATCGSVGVLSQYRTFNLTYCVLPEDVHTTEDGREVAQNGVCNGPVCCDTTQWTEWSCSKHTEKNGCNQIGHLVRARSFVEDGECLTAGADLDLRNTASTECATDKCACEMTPWSEYTCNESACSSEGEMVSNRGYILSDNCQPMSSETRRVDGVCETAPCVCEPSAWSEWVCDLGGKTHCSAAGYNRRQRTYDVNSDDCVPPANVEITDEAVEHSQGDRCVNTPCCDVLAWSEWECNVDEADGCGVTGRMARSRTFVENDLCMTEADETNLHDVSNHVCSTDLCECPLSTWSEWQCGVTTCGSTGTMVSVRGYITSNGKCQTKDAELTRTGEACSTEACPCKAENWSSWTCSADLSKCGQSGKVLRERVFKDISGCILNKEAKVSADATSAVEIEANGTCSSTSCCELTSWSAWTCSTDATCGVVGRLGRTREHIDDGNCSLDGDEAVLVDNSSTTCMEACPECEVTEWSDWTCSVTECGSDGVNQQTRAYIPAEQCQSVGATKLAKTGTKCATDACACEPGLWAEWQCNANTEVCGQPGNMVRERVFTDTSDCQLPEAVVKHKDGTATEAQLADACNGPVCCKLSEWSSWECSVSGECGQVGQEFHERSRINTLTCLPDAADVLRDTDNKACSTDKCECPLSPWSEWQCDVLACGSTGKLRSMRGYVVSAECQAKDALLTRVGDACSTEPCSCIAQPWTTWSCTADTSVCGSTGVTVRTRDFTFTDGCVVPDDAVTDEAGTHARQTETAEVCSGPKCCDLSEWSAYACTVAGQECGLEGTLYRERTHVVKNECLPNPIDALRTTDNEKCYTDKCECPLTPWSEATCSATKCSTVGVLVSTRGYETSDDCEPKGASMRRETGPCQTALCPCQPSAWSEWTCSADANTCNSVGMQWRQRVYDLDHCNIPATAVVSAEGVEIDQGGACSAKKCCATTEWAEWTCTVSTATDGCGKTGKEVRERAFISASDCTTAGAEIELRTTNNVVCSSDLCECKLTEWTESQCSETACSSTGVLVATRAYMTGPYCQAMGAELRKEEGTCETEACVCEPAQWSEWLCDSDEHMCGAVGFNWRERAYTLDECVLAKNVVTDNGVEKQRGDACSSKKCCATISWGEWTCSKSNEDGCGLTGKEVRERSFIENDGCTTEGADAQLRNTNNMPCYTDKCECELSPWTPYKCSETACSSQGVMLSTRSYITTPECEPKQTALRREDGTCETEMCACTPGEWSAWTCSADEKVCNSIGKNLRHRTYVDEECTLPADLFLDEARREQQVGTACAATPCCIVSPWSEYECSVSEEEGCGLEGVLVRDRSFVHTDKCSTKGAALPLRDVINTKCYTSLCECTLSEWSAYSCSATACSTDGDMVSTRHYNTNDDCQEMDAELTRTDGPCRTSACICKTSEWSESVCDANESVCGSAGHISKTKTYVLTDDCVLPEGVVVGANGLETKQGQACGSTPCCVTSPWANWECTVTIATDGCGRTGVLVRDRVLLQNAQCSVAGVDVALRNTDNVVCHTDKCECPLTQWTAWTCSETACSSEGALVSTRGYIVNDNCQAMDAETHRTGGACSTNACLCKPSEWSAWACTADEKVCSSAGTMMRERKFAMNDCVVPEDITTDTHGVETQTHTSPCHTTPCCEITAWSEWVCTVADAAQCGLTGKYVRDRAFIETDSCSTAGADTGLRTTENVACSNAKCECPLTEWTDYKCSETACSSKGDMYSTRAYIADENCQTMSAETYRVDGACETEACLCKPSAWSGWLCDANEEICGSPGHNWRHRAYDVNECVVPDTIVMDDAGVETQMGGLCAATECCQTSPWSDYVCTVDLQTDGCGATGKLVRNREYLKNDKCTTAGADSDLFNTENVACHTDKCECNLTPWTTWSCSETACSTEGVMFATRGYEVKPSCQTMNAETYKTAGVCQTSACVCHSSAWSEWLCDLDSDGCGLVGKNWRQRKFDTDRCALPANIVIDADGFEIQTSGVPCYGKKCCATSTWSEWYCTVETEEMCGLIGKYVRDRAFVETDGCSIVGAEDGLRNTENVPCNNDLCECPLTAWTDFECSESVCSSEGVLVATRGYVTGPNCQTKDAETSKTGGVCKTEACVCTPSQWSSWVCDADTERCGSSGYNWRQRAYDLDDCVLPATIATDASGVETQRGEVCHGAECCVTSPWSEFVCTVNIQTDGCGVAGKLQRTRTFIEDGRCSTAGADIELMNTDNMDCSTDLCQCPLTEWTKLKCSETACGSTGVMYATRGYIAGPTCQVMDAETYRIEGSCETEACVCSPSGWSAWVCDSNMDVCGSVGHTWRERTFAIEDCVLPANIIVDEAGVERQQGDKCGAKPCCETTSWSEYMCTVRDADGCGLTGKLVRTRTFVHNDECTIAGAHVDLRHTDNEPCSTDKCECELTPWTDFKCTETSCSSEGVLFSTRGYMATDKCQTKDAATYREDGVCTTEACECKNSMWTEWHCDADDAFCSSVGATYRQRKFETEDCILPTDIVLDEDGFEVQTGSACTAKKCCDVIQWSDWTCSVGELDGCSVSGEYVRDRAYIVNDACTTAGDDTDLHNTENVACHTELCECAMTSWTEWKCSESACSSTGVTYATRGYMTGPHCQSKDAETYRTDGECKTEVCVCAPSEWTQWTRSANEAVCGSVCKNVRQRAYNGEECVLPEDIIVDDDRVEVQIGTSCRATECCGTSEWSEFVCSVNTHMDGCGVEGKLIRERAFIETDTCSTAGAMVDLRNTEDEACHTDKCECPMTPWSDYACSATACSTDGVMYSTRGYISGPNCQAMDVETRREDGPCSTEECVCKPTNWSKWQCDADVNKCGSRGKNKRYRQYVVSECELPADLVVSETGVETQTHEEDCYAPACCDTSAWTNWACSVSEAQGCGLTGEYVRTRAFVEDGKCITSGADTDLFNTNNVACHTDKCECPLTSWSEYVCSETVCSSEGVMTSTRGYVSGPNCRTMGAEMVRTGEVCKTDVCACVPSKWTEKVCNADMDICGSQGNYIQTRKFDTTDCDVPEGIVTDADGTETRVGEACHGPVCCDASPWSGWTCTVGDADGCGLTGHYIRERAYLTTDECSIAGANTVLVSNGDDECSTELCECEMTQWTEYTCTEEACSSQGEWVATRGYITASDCQTKDAETRRVDGVCQTEVCECEPTHWSEWQCDVDEHQCNAIGNNWRERHFAMNDDCVVPDTVAVDAAGVEKQMSATPCNAKPCCATSTWSDWECSVSTANDGCNREGHYVRERTFVETSKCTTEGSDATLRNTDNEACFTDTCECPLTQWTEWTCSVTACSSEGVQVSTRGYITDADCETRDAELHREQDSCTTPVCACKPSAWSPWACDVDTETCGNTGLNTRRRKFDLEGCQLPVEIVTNEQGIEMQSGASCEGPVCCSTNQWSTWSCSLSTQKNGCGLSGRLERTRDHILVDSCVAEGDDTDLYHTDNEACQTDLCECELSEWSAYECSEEACSSESVSYSTRAYLVEDDCQTMDAELYREDGKCTTVPCVCEPSSWTSWVCDADEATCGATGSTWRYRTYDLEACEMSEDVVSDAEGIEIQQGSKCHAKECCPVGQWTEWVCSMDTNKDGCGMEGTHIRSRDYITSSACMVKGDNISLEESDGSCYTELCECELTEWSQPVCDTTACSSEGVMRSTRGYITNEHCQTKDAALHKEVGSCETEACTCEPDTWTEWFCDADMNTCGSRGVTWRTRTFDLTQCDLPASVDADESGVETQTGGLCYGPRCCEITSWSEWTCSITATDGCGQTGHETRTREHIEDGECMVLEKATLQTSDGESCSNELCECVLQEWSSWVCSESACGTSGVQTRTRAYIADDDCHTNDEAVLTDTSGGVCVNEACACMPSWAEWTEVSSCTTDEVTGTQCMNVADQKPVNAPVSNIVSGEQGAENSKPYCVDMCQRKGIQTCDANGMAPTSFTRADADEASTCAYTNEMCECPCEEVPGGNNTPIIAGAAVGAAAVLAAAGAAMWYSRGGSEAVGAMDSADILGQNLQTNPVYEGDLVEMTNDIYADYV
ncbi:hypothetical protein SARC_00736 [Sphaeroforma arctica JP610]|uniref:Uncharacterized protein n=1 Tax=Sphaeroforma arctica JP610 TaxID=667725 RepID=A0A0L0GE52_9EUKA|nr:hypothetical protein SARC_00736 [Sphaeroforma arctica JP610]KNC87156.1 hypothetical protein SARC_00736 [Sphaeroforma arctica JP610]|eukprot:XP_014161058.1 hypothetical protein SARC_00736 [Sphaeroforma arctica JP610]